MITIEFIREYKCWEKGTVREVLDHFAETLIELEYAKAIETPTKNKMVAGSPKNKAVHA